MGWKKASCIKEPISRDYFTHFLAKCMRKGEEDEKKMSRRRGKLSCAAAYFDCSFATVAVLRVTILCKFLATIGRKTNEGVVALNEKRINVR